MRGGDEPKGQTLKGAMAGTSKSVSMPAQKGVDVKPVKVNPKSRRAILAKATPEEIAANKKKSQNYNYEDARKRAQAVTKRRAQGSNEPQVKKVDINKEMGVKRRQFINSFNAGTIETRSDLRDSIKSTFPTGTPAKEIRKAMPLTDLGRVAYKTKKAFKKGSAAAIAPVASMVRKVTTKQMNSVCPATYNK